MPPSITLHITDNAGHDYAQVDVPVPMSASSYGMDLFDAQQFEQLLDRGCIALRKVFDHALRES